MTDLVHITVVPVKDDCDCIIKLLPSMPIAHKIAYLEFVKQAICNTQELLQAEADLMVLDPEDLKPGPPRH